MGKSKVDDEITDLLTKLYTIQEDIGAKPKTTDDEKKKRAEQIADIAMGKGGSKKTAEKGTRFLTLKGQIVDRLKAIHKSMSDLKVKEDSGGYGQNAKDIIAMQAEIREQIRQATEEWEELDGIYKREAKKKKSKFTVEELEAQQEFVQRLHVEIDRIKEEQMKGYARNRTAETTIELNTKALYMDAPAMVGNKGNKSSATWGGVGGGGGGGDGVALTDNQKQQILELEQRDAEFDTQLDQIGEGIQDLAEIAQLQGEEVKRQNVMLEKVNADMDRVTDRMSNVNTRMKETLQEVGRSSDKLCIDIVCICLMVGFAAVIYNYVRQG